MNAYTIHPVVDAVKRVFGFETGSGNFSVDMALKAQS
jgi:hypothetical protein